MKIKVLVIQNYAETLYQISYHLKKRKSLEIVSCCVEKLNLNSVVDLVIIHNPDVLVVGNIISNDKIHPQNIYAASSRDLKIIFTGNDTSIWKKTPVWRPILDGCHACNSYNILRDLTIPISTY
jgi:hypothetical protein